MIATDFNDLPRSSFIARYAPMFEHSPWVVERAADRRPLRDLHEGLMKVVDEASGDDQLALIRAHPQLAGKAAVEGALTRASRAEQASAGLDRLTREEHDRFQELNAAYRARFGFPFVICVRRTDKAGILAAMAERLDNAPEDERRIALAEIGEIVRLRLAALK